MMIDDDSLEASNRDFREVPAGSMLDEFHFEMWVGCMQFLIGEDAVRAAFERETKTPRFRVARTPLDQMIDKACGVDGTAYAGAFCRWATPLYWGDETDLCPKIIAKLAE